MSNANVFDALKLATESLGKEIHRAASHKSVWLNAMPKGTYPIGTGLTQTTFTLENSEPTNDELGWEKVTSSLFGGANQQMCNPLWNDVEWGFREGTYSPERIAIRGPVICQSSLRYQFNVDSFLRGYVDEISKHSKRILENKLQNEYMRIANKVTIAGSGATASIADYQSSTATDIGNATLADTVKMEQGHLDDIAIRLIEDGATEGDSSGWITVDNGPVFPLICGMEASQKLLLDNAALREDARFGNTNELLKRLGASRVLGNFRHVVTTMPPRFSRHATDGTYNRVSMFVAKTTGVTKGVGVEINPLWRTAVYEGAIVLNPQVYRQLVVPSAGAAGLNFKAENYSGEWQFVVGGHKIASGVEDPLESLGRHYGRYELAFEPVIPTHGATIIFKR